jgi:hypothetical protein
MTGRHAASGQYTADPQLPTHQDELMASHEGSPSIAVQAQTHGAGIPAVDRGQDDATKYGNGSC